jgi:hypothetical protein
MGPLIEQLLELTLGFKAAYGECERFLRARALMASLSIIKVVRRAFILHHCTMMACFVWGLSFFGTGLTLCLLASGELTSVLRPALVFSAATLALSSALLFFLSRERTWLTATGLQPMLDSLQRDPPRPHVDRRELAALLDELLDERLAKLARSRDTKAA